MLKIYHAYTNGGKIEIENWIHLYKGEFNTGLNGFGFIKSSNPKLTSASYELQTLKSFREYIKTIKKTDGYVDDVVLLNPMTCEMIEEKYKDIPKNSDTYEKYGLNEEGILLFTDHINLTYPMDDTVQRIFGRHPETGMYLIMPNASFSITKYLFGEYIKENYEVLQSKNLGKQLVLSKMDRNI